MAKLEVFDSQDAVPEPLRDFYVEREGQWIPNAPPMMEAIKGERAQREAAIKRATDAERKFTDAERKLQELDAKLSALEADGKGGDGNGSAEFARLKKEYDARLATFEGELKGYKDKAENAERALQEKSINDVLRSAAMEAGVPVDSVDDLVALPRFRQPWKMHNGEPAPFEGEATLPRVDPESPSKPMSAKAYVQEYLRENRHWLPPSNGSGARGNGAGRAAGVITVTRAEMRDHQRYRAVTEDAEKRGATIQVVD